MKKEYAKNLAELFSLLSNGWINLLDFLLMSTLNPNDKLMCTSTVIIYANLISNIALICHKELKVTLLDINML